jgi:hypothetical protein
MDLFEGNFPRKTAVFLLSVGLFLSVLSAPAQAVDNSGPLHLTISPPIISLSLSPGETFSTSIRIKNEESLASHIQMNVEKFTADGLTGAPKILPPDPTDEFIRWVSFSQNVFDINPGEWKTITATFKIPSIAAFGYYYSIEFVRASPNAQDVLTHAHFNGAIAANVLLEVANPNVKRELQIIDFKTDHSFYEYAPVSFLVTVKNTGNVHLAPKGNIFISQGSKDIATLDVNRDQGFVLPGTERQFIARLNDAFPAYVNKVSNGKMVTGSDGKPQQELQWDIKKADKILIGPYDSRLLLVYDDGVRDIPLEGKTSYWVLPWKIILVGLVVLALTAFGLFQLMRVIVRSIRKRFGKNRSTYAG